MPRKAWFLVAVAILIVITTIGLAVAPKPPESVTFEEVEKLSKNEFQSLGYEVITLKKVPDVDGTIESSIKVAYQENITALKQSIRAFILTHGSNKSLVYTWSQYEGFLILDHVITYAFFKQTPEGFRIASVLRIVMSG